MNNEWAIQQLDEFIRLTQSVNASGNGYITPASRSVSPRHEVLQQWVVASKILEAVFPNWQSECVDDTYYEFGQRRDAAIHAKQLILRSKEIEDNLDPVGPALSSKLLHEWIWLPAKQLWSDGYYREAVQAAATKLDTQIQILLNRRDVTGRDLLNQAFSSQDPTPENPRFSLANQENDPSDRSYFEGMRTLGYACFALARNLTTHQLQTLDEHEALELLAMMSYFARQIEMARVVRA